MAPLAVVPPPVADLRSAWLLIRMVAAQAGESAVAAAAGFDGVASAGVAATAAVAVGVVMIVQLFPP